MDLNTERMVTNKNHAIVDEQTVILKKAIEIRGKKFKKGDRLQARKLSNGKFRYPVDAKKIYTDLTKDQVDVAVQKKVIPETKPEKRAPISGRMTAAVTVSVYAELPLIWFTPSNFALCKTPEECALMANSIAESILRAHIVSKPIFENTTKESEDAKTKD